MELFSRGAFSFGAGPAARTFIALNEGNAGFSSTKESLIEITGYTELLASLSIVCERFSCSQHF
jgi:hypothetical protein